MTQDEIIKKNLDLFNEFMRWAFEYPALLDQIPAGAELVILPENDAKLREENLKMVRALRAQGNRVVVIKLHQPEKVPPPEIEVVA